MSLPKSVPSPLTGKPSRLVRVLPTGPLVEAYLDRFQYDARHNFAGVPEVGLYLCESGLKFFFPFSVAGDESLYKRLQHFDWNYKEDKWEHEVAAAYVRASDHVLDIGCGEGNFLHKAQALGAHAHGIELNGSAAEVARGKGIKIHQGLLEDHASGIEYDLVTSFQVLEHVTQPLQFIRDALRLLRPGGRLLIGVPNDDGFLRLDDDAVLNRPPHHMSLWTRESLIALGSIVKVEVQSIEVEPLAELGWYQAVMEKRYLGQWQRRVFHRLGFGRFFQRYLEENARSIAGHTIMVVYKKPTPSAA